MRTSLFLLLFSAAMLVLGAGCGEEPKRPAALADGPAYPGGSGAGAGGSDGGAGELDAGEATADAGACTALENTGTLVDENAVVGEPPAGSGGTVVDGVYDLTGATLYLPSGGVAGPTGGRYRASIRITGTAFERALQFTSSSNQTSNVLGTGTFTQTGASGVIALTCPTPSQENVSYTATDTSLTLSNLVTKESFVFAKRP